MLPIRRLETLDAATTNKHEFRGTFIRNNLHECDSNLVVFNLIICGYQTCSFRDMCSCCRINHGKKIDLLFFLHSSYYSMHTSNINYVFCEFSECKSNNFTT